MIMIIYFENSKKELREIANIQNGTREKAIKEISKFLKAHNFKSYYQRLWNVQMNGEQMTCVDVGSWSEFFYITPPIMNQ